MPPLILHNVPDEELYVGIDGIQRPFAMVFPGTDGNPSISRTRRAIPETGSFGKSTRRSRSRTGTPAAKREDPTLAAADAIFSQFFVEKSTEHQSKSPQRKASLSASISQPNLSSGTALATIDGNGSSSRASKKETRKEPTEVILRGYQASQQYAAIREYERISGRICEDYPRDPPFQERKYKTDMRDQASRRHGPLTPEEKAKALNFAGGEHWIKVTFESAEAAEIAIESSPQTIYGHLVYAELYRGLPPTSDLPVPANGRPPTPGAHRSGTQSAGVAAGAGLRRASSGRHASSTLPRSHTTPNMQQVSRGRNPYRSISPPESHDSSQTLDTATVTSETALSTDPSSSTLRGSPQSGTNEFCHRIPTAKRIHLLPAEQALLPQQSFSKRVMTNIPIIGWLSADLIGNAVPRTEMGDFDWEKSSLYWKVVWWVDSCTGWFDVCGNEKDD